MFLLGGDYSLFPRVRLLQKIRSDAQSLYKKWEDISRGSYEGKFEKSKERRLATELGYGFPIGDPWITDGISPWPFLRKETMERKSYAKAYE